MVKKLALAALAAVVLGPAVGLLALGALLNPAANAACTLPSTTTVTVAGIPENLAATTADGITVTLDQAQLAHAATVITTGASIDGVGRAGIRIALMAALTESSLRQLSNTSAYPESANFANDGDGSDHDSLGLFQMRPQAGWGTVAELMDPAYQAAAFYGGPSGPNYPSPRGLLDIPGWQQMDPGQAAQAVEVSAYPDRYQNYQPVADTILDTLTTPGSHPAPGTDAAAAGRVVFPLPTGTWVIASPFGPRPNPAGGDDTMNDGADFAAPAGTPILAIADGSVTTIRYDDTAGGTITIEHTIGADTLTTVYGNLPQTGMHAALGQQVTAGQHIADIDTTAGATGPFLHLEIRPEDPSTEPIDPVGWLTDHHASNTPPPDAGPQTGCTQGAAFNPDTGITPPARTTDGTWPAETCSITDPTQPSRAGACVTPRTALLVRQIQAMQVGDGGIACWDPHPQNPTSDHPLGKACDIVFGTLGQFPAGADKNNGDRLAAWLTENADTWAVAYIIWQGRIWTGETSEWQPYNSSIYDTTDPTGGHYDHIHISVE